MHTPLLAGALIALVVGQASVKPRVQLADGTPVLVRVLQLVSSETSRAGDPVRLEVARRVIVDANIAIEQGTMVSGTVVDARRGATSWQTARLAIAVKETRSAAGEVVRLRSVPIQPFRGRTAYILWFSQGITFEALVDGDQMVTGHTAWIEETPARVVEIPLSTAADVLTNEDVLKLIRAGFGEDLVIAKIETSRAKFQLNPDDLIELKKNGVPDQVLTAMIRAAAGER